MSCVLTLCHTNCLNFVLNSGHQSRAFTLGQVPSEPLMSFPVSWTIVRANCFYPPALGRQVWLWSLPFQKGSFTDCFSSSPGSPVLGLCVQRCREGEALTRPQERFPIPPLSQTRGHSSDFSHGDKSLLQGD